VAPPSAASARVAGGLKPAQLVELAIVGWMRLRRDGQCTAPSQGDRAVVECSGDAERKANREDEVPGPRGFGERGEGFEGGFEQPVLEEEISARVAREPEFGADGIVRPGLVGGPQLREMGVGVEGRVGDPHGRHADRHAGEAMAADVEEGLGHGRPS
jgi:hypothetical protein